MVALRANFEADWIAHLKNQLSLRWGATVTAGMADRDIPIFYFETFRRKIAILPRAVKIADDFHCLPQDRVGWNALQAKIKKGCDLNQHLSTRHASLFNDDGLLAEWGVHHFHLGTKPYPRDPRYADRTRPLVFALVDDRIFYAINVFPHGDWENTQIVESIHRNWPEVISQYRVDPATGIRGEALDKTARRSLRKYHVNVFISTSDGTVYAPLGGGTMGNGVHDECYIFAIKWRDEIRRLERGMERYTDNLIPMLAAKGYAGEGEVNAELRIGAAGYQVFFPQYSVLANLSDRPFFE